MDSQLPEPKVITYRLTITLIAIAVILIVFLVGLYLNRISDPYIQKVLTLQGDNTRGYQMFQLNCAPCHGITGDGSVGPSLHDVPKRKSKISLIEQVISGKTPPMPAFQPSEQEMADLLSYLQQL